MKKLISILICAAMILSLIPAVAAAGETTLEYVFTNTAQGGSGTVRLTDEAFHGWAIEGAEWQFVNMVNYSACALYNTYLNWGFSASGKPEYNGENKMTGAYAIELDIPEAGTYTPALKYRAAGKGATAEIYLVEKEKFATGASGEYYFDKDSEYDGEVNAARRAAFISAVKAMSANDRLGTVNTYCEAATTDQPKTFRDIVIEKAGSYILVVVPTGAEVETEDNVYNIQLQSFVLDKVVKNTAVEQEFKPTDVYAFKSYNNSGTVTSDAENGCLNVKEIQTRYYHMSNEGTSSRMCGYVVFRLSVLNSGEYTIQLKTNNPTAISAAPEIYLVADDGTIKWNTVTSTGYSSTAKGGLVGENSVIGYFDFSEATGDSYSSVTDVNGSEVCVTVPTSGNYFLVLSPNTQSRAINSNTSDGDLVEGGIVNSTTGAVLKGMEITAGKYLQEYYLSGIKLVPVADEHINVETDTAAAERESIQNENGGNLSAEADKVPLTANINALTMFGDEVKKDTVTAGTEVTVTAPDKPGYSFLYWAKGLTDKKVIVSDKKSYTFTAVRENNPLIAVYTSDTAETNVEFYNGNFQLLDATLDAENKLPPLPTEGIAGYGEATHWERFGDDKEYAPGDVISPSGKMIFVAQYDELEKDIKVTVNGNVKMCSYGELVTETAPARSGSDVFNYWLRDGQIVGFGKTYSFYAYEDCELTGVYKEYEPINKTLRKIILDTMEDGRLMAEFIGFGDAAEKGIMIGSKKIAMTTASSQFALYNDENGDVVGYAVDKSGNIYYEK